jgi:hypothetical protein
MKLFVFRPNGHGSETFMVVQEDEAAARTAVDNLIAKNKQEYQEYRQRCDKVRGLRGTRTYIPPGPEYRYPEPVYELNSDGWGTDYYEMEVYEPGQVATNENS